MKHLFRWTHTRIIAVGFAAVILCGTGLLCLPVSHTGAVAVGFWDALFTAVSCTCVTGLAVCDTFTAWSAFGQLVILLMIQIGGLGFMTFATRFYLLFRRRVSLRSRQVLSESISATAVGGVVRLSGRILRLTLCFEGVGALLLAVRFVPVFGWGRGLWFGLFHAVSAFCNAGFDLMGVRTPYSSFTAWVGDPLVVLTLSALIIVGGLGFLVWDDIGRCRLRFKRYSLHSKVVLVSTAVLLVGGTLLFLLVERNATGAGLSPGVQVLAAFFDSVTPRTAGFNTVDTAALSGPGKLLTIVLMFIGGSPGSTAGGVKTTTLFVLLICMRADVTNSRTPVLFGRRLSPQTLRKASTVFFCNLTLALAAGGLIGALQPALPFDDVLFEVFSAIGTVGMTTGLTRQLGFAARVLVMILMYCGRLGSISFAMAIAEHRAVSPVEYPEGDVTVG